MFRLLGAQLGQTLDEGQEEAEERGDDVAAVEEEDDCCEEDADDADDLGGVDVVVFMEEGQRFVAVYFFELEGFCYFF